MCLMKLYWYQYLQRPFCLAFDLRSFKAQTFSLLVPRFQYSLGKYLTGPSGRARGGTLQFTYLRLRVEAMRRWDDGRYKHAPSKDRASEAIIYHLLDEASRDNSNAERKGGPKPGQLREAPPMQPAYTHASLLLLVPAHTWAP